LKAEFSRLAFLKVFHTFVVFHPKGVNKAKKDNKKPRKPTTLRERSICSALSLGNGTKRFSRETLFTFSPRSRYPSWNFGSYLILPSASRRRVAVASRSTSSMILVTIFLLLFSLEGQLCARIEEMISRDKCARKYAKDIFSKPIENSNLRSRQRLNNSRESLSWSRRLLLA